MQIRTSILAVSEDQRHIFRGCRGSSGVTCAKLTLSSKKEAGLIGEEGGWQQLGKIEAHLLVLGPFLQLDRGVDAGEPGWPLSADSLAKPLGRAGCKAVEQEERSFLTGWRSYAGAKRLQPLRLQHWLALAVLGGPPLETLLGRCFLSRAPAPIASDM